MKIDLPCKIHNKFEIEVKDITTGEIVQRGYAKNIVLDNMFEADGLLRATEGHPGSAISFGSGIGILDAARTTLFSKTDTLTKIDIETIINQPPFTSYGTRKIVLNPADYVGAIITEVGLSNTFDKSVIYTHALIKDSEGKPLTLGPKTDTQEITIYATVYFQPNFDSAITYYMHGGSGFNPFVNAMVLMGQVSLANPNSPLLYLNNKNALLNSSFYYVSKGLRTGAIMKVLTSQANEKIKQISLNGGQYNRISDFINMDVEILAENNSTIWGGNEFDKIEIGIGDGTTTTFNLEWDEVWMEKPKMVYIDGVATDVIWTENTITFENAPPDQSKITADYWVKYIPKDENHELHCQFSLLYEEGVPV